MGVYMSVAITAKKLWDKEQEKERFVVLEHVGVDAFQYDKALRIYIYARAPCMHVCAFAGA